jgi:hypothetical protein
VLLAVATLLGGVGWLASAQNVRFALPMAALLAVIASVGVARVTGAARVVSVVALVLGAGLGVARYADFTFRHLQMWRGVGGGAEAWRHTVTVNDPLPAYRAADRLLPGAAGILVVGDGRSWGCPRPHHVSSPVDRQLVQTVVEREPTAAAVAAALGRAGYTYLVINWGEIERLHDPPHAVLAWSTPVDAARWRRFLLERTERVWSGSRVEIRRIESNRAAGEPIALQ